jgi:hypothetical protein
LIDISGNAVTAGIIIRNCIFWMPNNTGNAIKWNGVSYTIADFLALPAMSGLGNLHADPLFLDAPNGDFRLNALSPAIGAGIPVAYVTTDFAGNNRSLTTPSIGAYE